MWRAWNGLLARSRDLLHDHMKANENTWDDHYDYFRLMVRWIAALAELQPCSLDAAAAAIDGMDERKKPNGQAIQMDTFKTKNAVRLPGGVKRDAFFIAESALGGKQIKDHLELYAAGCDVPIQLRCQVCHAARVPEKFLNHERRRESRWVCRCPQQQ